MGGNNVRLRKEYKLKTEKSNFKVIFGTTNRINPSVIYVKINTWVKYTGIIKDYNENINALNSSTKISIKQQLKHVGIFENAFFYTPEIKKVMFNNNNSFHACFEFTIKQKGELQMNILLLSKEIGVICEKVGKTMEKSNVFEFSSKK
jgi:hypothetical protein